MLSAQSLSYSETVYNQSLTLSGCADFACLLDADPLELVTKLASLALHVPFVSAYLPWAPTVDGVEFEANPFLLARCVAGPVCGECLGDYYGEWRGDCCEETGIDLLSSRCFPLFAARGTCTRRLASCTALTGTRAQPSATRSSTT